MVATLWLDTTVIILPLALKVDMRLSIDLEGVTAFSNLDS